MAATSIETSPKTNFEADLDWIALHYINHDASFLLAIVLARTLSPFQTRSRCYLSTTLSPSFPPLPSQQNLPLLARQTLSIITSQHARLLQRIVIRC